MNTVDALLRSCFSWDAEARLVRKLRADGDMLHERVVTDSQGLVGYIGFSRLTTDVGMRAAALAPLAVRSDRRREGFGAILVTAGLETLAHKGLEMVLVLGEPDYYARFGFSQQAALVLDTPWDGPYMQALSLNDTHRIQHSKVHYPLAFIELS